MSKQKSDESAFGAAAGSAQNFDQLCRELTVTKEEREELAFHLAGIRYRNALTLIKPPITRAALAARAFALDGKVPVVRGKYLLREKPNNADDQRSAERRISP